MGISGLILWRPVVGTMRLSRLPLFAGSLLALASPASAQSGCGAQFGAGKFCGNPGGSTGLPGPSTVPAGSITPGTLGNVLTGAGSAPPAFLQPPSFNLENLGMVCGGDLTKAAANKTAFDNAMVSGRKRFVVPSVCVVTTLATLPGGISISGGSASTGILKTTSSTGAVLPIGGVGVTLSDLGFDTTAPRTTGHYYVDITFASNVNLNNISMSNTKNGINLGSNNATTHISGGQISALASFDKLISVDSGGTGGGCPCGIIIEKMNLGFGSNTTFTGTGAAIFVGDIGDLTLINNLALGNNYALLVNPGNGQATRAITARQNFFDSWGTAGIYLNPTGTGVIQNLNFTSDYVAAGASSATNAIIATASGSASIDGVTFTDMRALGAANTGVVANCVLLQGRVENVTWIGGVAANCNVGFHDVRDTGFDHLNITGARIGPWGGFAGNTSFGLALTSTGGDYALATVNDLTSNIGANYIRTSTAAHDIVQNNPGANPIGASAPGVGASPWTYTAGPTSENLNCSASTSVTALTQNGVSVLPAATAANATFNLGLGPNEVSIWTYTGTLTCKTMIH